MRRTITVAALAVTLALATLGGPARAAGEGLLDLLGAEKPDADAVKALLERDPAQLKARAEGGASPLHVAARRGLAPIVEALLAAGADVAATDDAGSTPLHAAAAAEGARTEEIVLALLGAGADPNVRDAAGSTPLHRAVAAGKIGAVDGLLAREARLDATDAQGRTVLHIAALSEVPERRWMALHLLSRKADRKAKDAAGRTAAEAARAAGAEPTAALIEGGMAAAEQLLTVEQWLGFAKKGNAEVLRVIHELKKDLIDATDEGGRAALHIAIAENHPECARLLIHWGADIERATKGPKHTPLHLAAAHGRDEVARRLIGARAKIAVKDADGCTPLHLAAATGQHRVARLLLQSEAQADARTATGQTPLHLAAATTGDSERDLRRRKVEAALVLLEAKAAVDAEDAAGKTPLHLAVEAGFADMVATLVKKGANPRVRAKESGETAWDAARRLGDARVIEALRVQGE